MLRKHLTSLNGTLHLKHWWSFQFIIEIYGTSFFQKLSMKGQTFFSFLSTYECSLRTFLLWHDPSSKEKSFSWFFEDTTKIVEKGGQEPLRKCGLLVQPMSQWNEKIYRRAFLVLQPIFFSCRFKVTKTKRQVWCFCSFWFFPLTLDIWIREGIRLISFPSVLLQKRSSRKIF